MDNLTHSLAGAVLGQMGLKRTTGLAMATLIIAANIPDVDAICIVFGIESLAMRRGITHGPIALLVLPFLLTAAMVGFDKWQSKRGSRPADRLPVKPAELLTLAYIGTISHPALDWLNNYGVRFFEPISSQWAYGDTLFIIDVWIWAALSLSVWLSLKRERRGNPYWRAPARAGFGAVCVYIAANGLITSDAENAAAETLYARHDPTATIEPELVVANAVPFEFWRREIAWRDSREYGNGVYQLGSGASLSADIKPHNMADPRVAALIAVDQSVKAFLFWSRMPVAKIEAIGGTQKIVIRDQRYMNPLLGDRFSVAAKLEDSAK